MNQKSSPRSLQNKLLKWFDAQKREMPWRNTKDPYKIWISEIMLQQTQVKTVIPYFRRWMIAFPTIEKLAHAREDRVLKFWEGLGYYSRARNLHKAAKVILIEHNGKVPNTMDDIIKLPGIGRYTSGAILSIAFDMPYPVLDGNVKRVISRLFTLKENGANGASENKLWNYAEKLVPKKRPGDFNQSLMELGATICIPKNPLCLLCPVATLCQAKTQNIESEYPPKKTKQQSKKIEVSAAVIFRNGKVFIQQRPHKGLMGGLWEFPGGKRKNRESEEDCLKREIQEELDVQVNIQKKIMTIKHSYTQFRVTLNVFLCKLKPGRIKASQCDQWKWVSPEQLKQFTFPAANVKIVEYLTNESSSI